MANGKNNNGKAKTKVKPNPEVTEDMTRIHIWLSVEQINILNQLSEATGLTRSFLLRDAITHWLSTRAEKVVDFIEQS